MSTRSTISVKDNRGQFFIYRHSDGYPDGRHGVVATLAKAFPFAWPLPRFEADEFAAAIVAAWKKAGKEKYSQGGNIRFTTGHDAHGDTEYMYDITCKEGKLQLKIDGGETFEGSYEDAVKQFKGA